MRVEIINNKNVGVEGLTQQIIDACSSGLGTLFLKDHSHLFKETNRYLTIVDLPLSNKQRKILSYLTGTYFFSFQSGSSPENLNPTMVVGILNP